MENKLLKAIKDHYPNCYIVDNDTMSVAFYKYRYQLLKTTDELYWCMVAECGNIEVYQHSTGEMIELI